MQGLDLRPGRVRERLECSERVADGRRVRQSRTRRGQHLGRRAVERGKGGKRIAPRGCKPRAERNHGRDVLGAQSFEEFGILRVAAHAGAGCERSVDADMTEVEVQRAHTRGVERRQQQQDHLGVAGNARFTEKLGADLCDLARFADPGGRTKNAAGIAEARDAGLVQEVRVDPGDLRRDVGANAKEPARHRIDDLERLQVEIVTRAGQQRIEMLHQRRLHEAETMGAEMFEQRATQRFHPFGFNGQDVLDVFRQDPLTHGERASKRRARGRSRQVR